MGAGRVFLADGTEVKIVTGIDDHSRFVVCAKAVMRATARPVCQPLDEALARHGIPEQILTDNGKVFTARFGRGPRMPGCPAATRPGRRPSACGLDQRWRALATHGGGH